MATLVLRSGTDVDLAAERMLQMALERKVVARGKRTDEIDVGGGVEVTWTFDGTEDDRLIDRYPRRFERLHQTLSGRRPELLPRASPSFDRTVKNVGRETGVQPPRAWYRPQSGIHKCTGECECPGPPCARRQLRVGLDKATLRQRINRHRLNERQRKIIDRLLDNFQGHLTTPKYAKLAKCSNHTVLRDIRDLLARNHRPQPGPRTHHELPARITPSPSQVRFHLQQDIPDGRKVLGKTAVLASRKHTLDIRLRQIAKHVHHRFAQRIQFRQIKCESIDRRRGRHVGA